MYSDEALRELSREHAEARVVAEERELLHRSEVVQRDRPAA
jgi:hypothetical protein